MTAINFRTSWFSGINIVTLKFLRAYHIPVCNFTFFLEVRYVTSHRSFRLHQTVFVYNVTAFVPPKDNMLYRKSYLKILHSLSKVHYLQDQISDLLALRVWVDLSRQPVGK